MQESIYSLIPIQEKTKLSLKEQSPFWLRRFLVTLAVATLALSPSIHQVRAQTSTQESSPEVYYGNPANEEETASSVWLSAGGTKRGSGTIISNRVIVTALHTVTKIDSDTRETYDPSIIHVFLAGNLNEPGFQVLEINILGTPHPQNDLVELTLSRDIPFSKTVHAMPIGHEYMANTEELRYKGHGRSEEGFFTQHPRVAKQLIDYDRSKCNYHNKFITKPDPAKPEVIHKGDSGGALYAYIPEDTEEYKAGYYFLGALTLFCGERTYDENGMLIPDYGAIADSIFFEDADIQLQKIIEEADLLPDEYKYLLPLIKNRQATLLHLPSIHAN